MIVTFEKDYLRELYINGKTSDKKHRYQSQIIKKYTRIIDLMIAALLIGQALGVEAAPLLVLQMKYNLLLAKRDKSFARRLKGISKIAAAI